MIKIIKRLAKSIKGYRFEAIITPIFMIVEVLMESLIVLNTKELINMLSDGNPQMALVWPIAIKLVLCAIGSLSCGIGGGVFGAKASVGFACNLRREVFYKIQDFSFENIDSFQTSSLVTRLTTDISQLRMSFQMILRIAVRVPLQMIMAIIISFSIDAELSWFFVFIVPFLLFGLIMIMKVAMPTFTRLFKKYDAMNNSIQENIRGIRVVKTYVREDFEIKKYNQVSDSLAGEFTHAERIVALNGPLMGFCIHLAILLISYLGSLTVIRHTDIFSGNFTDLKIGDMQVLITYGIQMLGALQMLSMIFVMLSMSYECAKRVVEVLNTESNLVNPEDPIYEVANGDIEFRNVNFKYKKDAAKYALYDINLNIKSGETIGIIGGTGSSKTTLVNLISRLYDVTEGEILVGDIDVRKYDLDTLRNNVAVVLQKNLLFSGTVMDNLRWGKEDATLEECRHVCKIAEADSFVMAHPDGYDRFIEQGGANVSGGQKQRLCIARALLKNPKVIIFDDSTSAVDTKTDAAIRQALKTNLPNVTKIIIAQRIASVQDADKIIVMENGTIDAIGNHEELLKSNAIYQEVYYSQNKVGD